MVLNSHLGALSDDALGEISSSIRSEAKARGLIIQGDDSKEMIPLALTPWIIRRETARYLQSFFRGIRRTVNRILAHYFEDPRLQEILPLRESEILWFKASCAEGVPRPQTIFERFDTNLGPPVEEGLASFQVIEFNAVGVGCISLMPMAAEILQTKLFPHLEKALADLPLVPPADYRRLLMEELKSHAKALERPSCRVALVERRETTPGGVDEFSQLASYFQTEGLTAKIGDPREIEHAQGEFSLKGEPIDVVYRDFQIEEVVSIKTHGGSVEGIEAAFAQNRVVSTVFGEFDHKSLCELLTNSEFSKYFSPQELRVARRRFPWTRLVEERRTEDWEGCEVDLLPTIRAHRERLVLKPNRGYGGEGVIVGETALESEWEQALQQAASKPKTWVVQEKVPIAKAPVTIAGKSGRPKEEEQFVTLGVTATSRGVAFVGRASPEKVVNITQGGAIVPVFLTGKR